MPDLTARLLACYTGAVYDVLREMGVADCVLPHDIRPLDPKAKLAGSVWTCSGSPRPGLTADDSLLSWTGMLSAAPAGAVVVCQPNDSTIAHMGELSAETLKRRGIRGYVVDGGCRDVDFILRLGFPVFCRYYTPMDVVGRWRLESMAQPITIGHVKISTGDYLLGDADGVVVIPKANAEEVVARTEKVISTESALRKAILSGEDPQQAYLKYRLF